MVSDFLRGFRKIAVHGFLGIGLFVAMPVAHADSLPEALLEAYRSNPELQADRARQRSTDEAVPQAKSGWRPTITTQGTATTTWQDSNVSPATKNTSLGLNIQLTQPVFRGFKTVAGVKSAKESVEAGRQALLATEESVLLQAATAYLKVLRDRKLLSLAQTNTGNLRKQARAAKARFDVGEITRTDVSQAQARVRGAEANAASAMANLQASMANYERVIGRAPEKLKAARGAKIPSSLEEALAIAQETNPNVLAAAHTHLASVHAIDVAKGDLLPSVNLVASASAFDDPQKGVERSEQASVQGVVTVPLYQGGREYSAVRKAKQDASQRQIQIISAVRSVREQVTAAWYGLTAARQAIVSAKAQVGAAAQALDGVKQEYDVGSRSTIDVLNGEQELLSAQISLANAQYSETVASYQLVAAIGRLTARNLRLSGPYYDAESNYKTVKDKLFGLDVETVQ